MECTKKGQKLNRIKSDLNICCFASFFLNIKIHKSCVTKRVFYFNIIMFHVSCIESKYYIQLLYFDFVFIICFFGEDLFKINKKNGKGSSNERKLSKIQCANEIYEYFF